MLVPLETLLADAPYLRELHTVHGQWLAQALADPNAALARVLADIARGGRTALDEAAIGTILRHGKAQVALLCAAAETAALWTTRQATAALSDLADAALEAGLAVLLRQAVERGAVLPEGATPERSGLAVFALGKHGGRELNYSSDIDIVAFYDVQPGVLADPGEATKTFSRLVQRLAALMESRTSGSYVFRTDLRLRPDPGSTPVAISTDAALTYYESRGQNWERAAWIKARPCAGDRRVADRFLRDLAPYIWRKHLDFATIADIQAMKRQINIAKSVGAARVEGHNVKLGRGGIREIEFFAQTQQLIAGGRDASLRVRPTTEALEALAASNWIAPDAAVDLIATYWFLRAVENRLQMRRDEQTHVMPEEPAEVAVIARLMDFADYDSFAEVYRQTLSRVMNYYAELFTEGEPLGVGQGSLVFTGSDDDPATLETLAALGFADPSKASATIRKWHYGGYGATRAAAARAQLTELMPTLLDTIGRAGNADATLARFDDFLRRLPSGVQLFALLRTHGQLTDLLMSFMASAPRMAEAVIHRAHVVDGLIDPAFADEISRRRLLVAKVDAFIGEGRDYQEVIDRARIIGQEQKFLIAAGLLAGNIEATRAGEQFTALAETLLNRLFASVRQVFAERHGNVPGAEVVLLGFGKMASREMTMTSDLDFIMLYRLGEADESDGEKPLAASHYCARLTQRLLAAVSAPTAEGVLYEVDMRLRPSGNAGPLATNLAGFVGYQRENAWTWEHLALSRARVVAGDTGMITAVGEAIAEVLANPRDIGKIVDDVVSMRALMARERPPRHPFDLKLATGGLVDLEFIAQSGQLVAGATLAVPQATTVVVLERMGITGLLSGSQRLIEAHQLYSTILQVMSAALLQPFRDEEWTDAFRERLAHICNYPSFERLQDDVTAMEADVVAAADAWYTRARTL